MDKTWITMNPTSFEYIKGVESFLDFAFAHTLDRNVIICPCNKCQVGNNKWFTRDIVEYHLMFNGFWRNYTNWVHHGETIQIPESSNLNSTRPSTINIDPGHVDTTGLLYDIFENDNVDLDFDMGDPGDHDNVGHGFYFNDPIGEGENHNDAGYERIRKLAEEELYSGSSFSKLSFILHLFHLKSMHGWSIKSFDMLLKLLISVFPDINPFPSSWNKCKQLKKDLGFQYEKIHSCPNDCILYWGGRENQDECDKCNTSRWIDKDRRLPNKVLRYFPLIPRLLRMFKSSKIAEDMIWYHKDRTVDGILRHPADGQAWKDFDERYPDFASEPRNVRLGLASDGFNPFRIMSSTHSTWPVLLVPYNLPPWLCMKQSSIIVSMIIPGEKAPGNDIDVYLQPLIKELLQLWQGVDAFDAYTKTKFKLRATLHSTINDFPAYANLSGWSTKGRYACPSCGQQTCSIWLENGHKFCYMGHRRWLPYNHPLRYDDVGFNENVEFDCAPVPCSGSDILAELERTTFTYGKCVSSLEADEKDEKQLWKKKSIFYDLPYWEFNNLQHNLDVMHIEKNICDNILGTLLNIEGKSKDNYKARKDLEVMKIRPELYPILLPNGKFQLPNAPYTMSSEEKTRFLTVLKHIKVPDGYASNISRCVNLKERRLFNMKTHDCHILMQDLLPIALRAAKDTDVVEIMSSLSCFFKELCAKELSTKKLDELGNDVVLILCHLEKVFLPSFFTIMVHLIVHLTEEAKLGGPVLYRWMYPIERYLASLKAKVRNRAQPEGSMAEGYIAQECITFCSRYFDGVETVFNRPKRNEYNLINDDIYLFGTAGIPKGKVSMVEIDEISLQQAHRYVLLHLDNIDKYHRLFLNERVASYDREISDRVKQKWLIEAFPRWLQEMVPRLDDNTSDTRMLTVVGRGPNSIVKRMKGFIINGYRFHTQMRDKSKKTQNFGVMVELEGKAYYGKINDIIELDYFSENKVVLFRCDWVNVNSRGLKKDKRGFILVNFSHRIHEGSSLRDDPFILSAQAQQVFYVEDEKDKGWEHIIRVKPRDSYNLGSVNDVEEFFPLNDLTEDELSNPTNWVTIGD